MRLKRQHLAYSLSGKHLLYINRKRAFITLRNYKRLSFRYLLNKRDGYGKKREILLNYDKKVKNKGQKKSQIKNKINGKRNYKNV